MLSFIFYWLLKIFVKKFANYNLPKSRGYDFYRGGGFKPWESFLKFYAASNRKRVQFLSSFGNFYRGLDFKPIENVFIVFKPR